jgi:malate dehydrogenase (oxaloacetate-decarboxylating)(NADP+)
MDPTASVQQSLFARARRAQARMIFAEGDDERVLRAAVSYQRSGLGQALVVGEEADTRRRMESAGLGDALRELTIVNAANTRYLDAYKTHLYKRLQRKGLDQRDVHRMATRDRHVFAALMLAHNHGDGLVTGATRKSALVMDMINHVFDARDQDGAVGVSVLLHKGRILLVADTLVHEWPEPEDLADIAIRAAGVARSLGLEPRVAFVSFSTFGYPISERASKMHRAPEVLDRRRVDFEYEGEMTVDVALNPQAAAAYPFSRLRGPANILVVPARHSASISVKLMQEMAGATVIGPILTGVPQPIQIASNTATVNDILNLAVMAACRVGL